MMILVGIMTLNTEGTLRRPAGKQVVTHSQVSISFAMLKKTFPVPKKITAIILDYSLKTDREIQV